MLRRVLRPLNLASVLLYLLVRLGNFAPEVVAERLQHFVSSSHAICQIQPDLKTLFAKLMFAGDLDPVATAVETASLPAAVGSTLPDHRDRLAPQVPPGEIFIPPERTSA